jgi:hypothetical protein
VIVDLVRLGPYQWRVTVRLGGAGDAGDAAEDLAAACGSLSRLPAAPAARRACLQAFLAGYRQAGGVAVL